MQRYVIGVDIGTGSTKAVAVNCTGEVLAASQFYYPAPDGLPGYAEQDAELIWQAFVNAVKEIIESLKYPPLALSFSSCMHSLLLIGNDHKPLTNLITWADTRSDEIADQIRNSPEAENIYKATGTPIHSMSPLCKIIWFKNSAPEIYFKTLKFISIKEFIWYRLFKVYQIDYSIASATGLFNIQNYTWNTPSLSLCGIDAGKLSEIVTTKYTRTGLVASSATLLGITADTAICIGASDGCLANVGSDAIRPGVAAITIGTSGAVRIANSTPVYNYASMTFNYVLDEEHFICGGPVNNGGNTVKWLFKSFLNITDPSAGDYNKLFESVKEIPAGADGLLFLPYLQGERAPVWDEKTGGVFFGIKERHSNHHFLKAVLEGICYSLNSILQIVESFSTPVIQINVSGGFIHSQTWMQILADITGKRICVVQTSDASAAGAAIFCMKVLNIANSSLLPPGSNAFIEYDARNHSTYQKYFGIFKNLYSALKESMHQLHTINS